MTTNEQTRSRRGSSWLLSWQLNALIALVWLGDAALNWFMGVPVLVAVAVVLTVVYGNIARAKARP